MPVDVHHCPRCELRFTTVSELQDHFTIDHAADPDTFTRFRYPAGRSARAAADRRRRILLVANQTLEGEHLVDRLVDTVAGARVFVLVPATHSADQAVPRATRGRASGDDADDVGVALARWRLRTTIDRLRAAGVDAEGAIGHPDPFTAVARLLESAPFDEILLSTLPPASSRWLQADLPARLHRQCHLPVTTLVGAGAA
jgi:hypothetical protein